MSVGCSFLLSGRPVVASAVSCEAIVGSPPLVRKNTLQVNVIKHRRIFGAISQFFSHYDVKGGDAIMGRAFAMSGKLTCFHFLLVFDRLLAVFQIPP